jgi:hypothetical protein
MDIPLYNDFQKEQQERIEQKMEQKIKEEKKIQEIEKIPCAHTIGEPSFYRQETDYYIFECVFKKNFF